MSFVPASPSVDLSSFSDHTLIVAAPVAGNVPALASDYIVASLPSSDLVYLGFYHDPYNQTPYLAVDATATKAAHLSGVPTTAAPLYAIPSRRALLLQLRSPPLPRRTHSFTGSLARWIASTPSITRTIVLTSDAAHKRGDTELSARGHFAFFTVEPETASLPSAEAPAPEASFFHTHPLASPHSTTAAALASASFAAPSPTGAPSAAALSAPLAAACARAGLPPAYAQTDLYAEVKALRRAEKAAARAAAAAAAATAAATAAPGRADDEALKKEAEAQKEAESGDICASPAPIAAAAAAASAAAAAAGAASGDESAVTDSTVTASPLSFPIAVTGRGLTFPLARACRRLSLPLAGVVAHTHAGENSALARELASKALRVAAEMAGLPQGQDESAQVKADERGIKWKLPLSWEWADNAGVAMS